MFLLLPRIRLKITLSFCCFVCIYFRFCSGQSSQNINVCKSKLGEFQYYQWIYEFNKIYLIKTNLNSDFLMFESRKKLIKYVCIFISQVFINEVDNDPASQAVEIVMNYIKKNPSLGVSVQLMPIEGNRTDSKKFLENSELLFVLIILINYNKNRFETNQI